MRGLVLKKILYLWRDNMDKNNLWLVLTIIALFILIVSIFMSYKTGGTEYAWIIGSMLCGIVSGNQYNKGKKK